jgi:hypothetical protein
MIQPFWNKAVEGNDRPLVPRDYVYASELGGGLLDRYLKMKGTPVTNPPNGRAKRKMMAGNFTEAVILYIFQRAGILQHSQKRFESEWTPLSVHGKSDIIIGGKPNLDQARSAAVQFEYFPEMHEISMKIIEGLSAHIEVPEMLYEVKSIATYKADDFERKGDKAEPINGHRLQTGFYTIERMLPYSILSYVCRDDLRMTEFYIYNTPEIQKEIYDDVAKIKGYLEANERPPLEPMIVIEGGKFSKNFNVEYSSYLTMLYGFEEPREYSELVKKDIAKWNRVLVRYKNGDKITDKNKEVRDEIVARGFDFEKILSSFDGKEEEED